MTYRWFNNYNKDSGESDTPNLLPEGVPIYLIYTGYWDGSELVNSKIEKCYALTEEERKVKYRTLLRYNSNPYIAPEPDLIGSKVYKATKEGSRPHKGYLVDPCRVDEIAFSVEEAEAKLKDLQRKLINKIIWNKQSEIEKLREISENL